VVAVFIITFLAQPFRIPSESMEPTLLVGDFLLVSKQNFPSPPPPFVLPRPLLHRGDVIVFHYPVDPSIHLVKRIIGLPGDHLRLRNGRVFIDGRALMEPYALYRPGPADPYRDNFPRLQNPDPDVDSNWWIQMGHLVNHGELTIPPGEYFVLGDNRNDSEDSRYWGLVPATAIVGKPFLIYFSLAQPGFPDRVNPNAPTNVSGPLAAPPPRRTGFAGVVERVLGIARWGRTLRIVE